MATVPARPWDSAGIPWRQGEHVTLIGPTGCGKTTVALQLLPRRAFTVALATKPKDPLMAQLVKRGWKLRRGWPPPYDRDGTPKDPRVVFWPPIERAEDVAHQREASAAFLEDVYRTGGWCVYLDELRYVTGFLGLERMTELLWLQGRSLGVSLVAAAQRPAWVPLAAFSQATHLFLWRTTDRRDIARLGEIGGVDTQLIAATVPRLDLHQALYVNTRTGALWTTRPPRLN